MPTRDRWQSVPLFWCRHLGGWVTTPVCRPARWGGRAIGTVDASLPPCYQSRNDESLGGGTASDGRPVPVCSAVAPLPYGSTLGTSSQPSERPTKMSRSVEKSRSGAEVSEVALGRAGLDAEAGGCSRDRPAAKCGDGAPDRIRARGCHKYPDPHRWGGKDGRRDSLRRSRRPANFEADRPERCSTSV